MSPSIELPWLPEGRLVALPGRGGVFARVHRHADALNEKSAK